MYAIRSYYGAPELVVDFCKKLIAPKKEIVWFEESAHHPNIDEPEKFQKELIKILKKNINPEQPYVAFSFDDGNTKDILNYKGVITSYSIHYTKLYDVIFYDSLNSH